jgi:hypothetical protein
MFDLVCDNFSKPTQSCGMRVPNAIIVTLHTFFFNLVAILLKMVTKSLSFVFSTFLLLLTLEVEDHSYRNTINTKLQPDP